MADKKPARAGSRTNTTKKAEAASGTAAEGSPGTGSSAKAGAGSAGSKVRAPGRAGTASETGSASRGSRSAGSKAGSRTGAKAGAKSGGSRSGAAGTAKRGGSGSGIQGELRSFVAAHPHGWNHDDWNGLLGRLQQGGHDASDHNRIGMELEKERLVHTLEQANVSGLGPSKIRSLADRFGTLWSFRHASVDEIASVKGMKREQAEAVHAAVH
jgi:hypothetical protein